MSAQFRIVALLLLLPLFALTGCSGEQRYTQRLYVFGTLVDITVYSKSEREATTAINKIARDFQVMHHDWHAWEEGPLMVINRALSKGEPVSVIPSLRPVIKQSIRLSEATGGLFNPAIGRLLNLWGFQSSTFEPGPMPANEAIRALVEQHPSMSDLTLTDDGVLTSTNSSVQLDFGGIAKGYAVDLAIEQLRAAGITDAMVNAGGDLRAIGHAGDRPWRVGVRHPQGPGVIASVEVEGDESVFTSGNYERFREIDQVRYPHILDPRTGMPVNEVASATVLHESGTLADAAATALVVAGVKEWRHVVDELQLKYVMLVDNDGRIYITPEMEKRVTFSTPPEVIIVE